MTTQLRDHLNKDTFSDAMLRQFAGWCIWQQARPALIQILEQIELRDMVVSLSQVETYGELSRVCQHIGSKARTAREKTGPLGYSTAEAAAFLTARAAKAATESDWDPEGVAFLTAQVCGWAGFARADYSDPASKKAAEQAAVREQEMRLRELWDQHEKSRV